MLSVFYKIFKNAFYTEDCRTTATRKKKRDQSSSISGTWQIHKKLRKENLTGKRSIFWKFHGRGILANIFNLKRNINYADNEIIKFFWKSFQGNGNTYFLENKFEVRMFKLHVFWASLTEQWMFYIFEFLASCVWFW